MGKVCQFLTELSARNTSVFFISGNINGFSPNLVCALISCSALDLLMAEFRPFLTVLSAHNTSVFYFQDINLSKSQWIFHQI